MRVDQLQGRGDPVTAIACVEPSICGDVMIYASMDKSLRVCKRVDAMEQAANEDEHPHPNRSQSALDFDYDLEGPTGRPHSQSVTAYKGTGQPAQRFQF